MNEYQREAMIGGWHMIPQDSSPRPKEREKVVPVWVGAYGENAVGGTLGDWDTDVYRSAYEKAVSRSNAAAQEPARQLTGSPNPAPEADDSRLPVAAAPFQVGDVVRHSGLDYFGVVKALDSCGRFKTWWPSKGWGALDKAEDLVLLGRPGPDGWIAHTPGECPVPGWVRVEVRLGGALSSRRHEARLWYWDDLSPIGTITHWRLAE